MIWSKVVAGGEGESVEERQVTQFDEQFQIFLGIALALLTIAVDLAGTTAAEDGVGREVRVMANEMRARCRAITAGLIGLEPRVEASGQAGRTEVREGNQSV